jgi:hypothetical protein
MAHLSTLSNFNKFLSGSEEIRKYINSNEETLQQLVWNYFGFLIIYGGLFQTHEFLKKEFAMVSIHYLYHEYIQKVLIGREIFDIYLVPNISGYFSTRYLCIGMITKRKLEG